MRDMSGLRNIHPDARIAEGVIVEPFATIGANVEIGEGTWIGPNACIMDGARIGKNCHIFPGAIVGAIPQDLKYKGEASIVEIGDNVTIREYCTINRGTEANYSTVIKNNVLLMAYVHIAHDCIVHENCILAKNVNLAGHIEVGHHTVIGGLAAVHQFVRIGEHVMIGGGSLVRKDVPPYIKAAREPIAYAGVNALGMRRRGFTSEQINLIQDIYRILFVKGFNIQHAIEIIENEIPDCTEKDNVIQFVKSASRGLIKGYRTN